TGESAYMLGIWNGLRLTGRWTRPLRMHWTQTRLCWTVPLLSTTLMFCRLGRNTRRLMPVTLRPTPPRYLALPRRAYWLPSTGFFPQMAHCMPMIPLHHANADTDTTRGAGNVQYSVTHKDDKAGRHRCHRSCYGNALRKA